MSARADRDEIGVNTPCPIKDHDFGIVIRKSAAA
jgi:hypothetical protein